MKKVLFMFMSGLILLTGCIRIMDNVDKNTASSAVFKERQLPKIPLKELKASVLESDESREDTAGLLKVLNQEIDNPSVTQEDLQRGWYFGKKHEKRYATPENWVWFDRGDESVWMRPGAALTNPFEKDAALCDSTAGSYRYSCYDYQATGCKYIGKSKCECPKQTRWLEGQGCILIDDLNDFVTITADEFDQGWYEGQKNMKKKDTPYGWQWLDRGASSRWQNSPQ